MFSSPSSVYTTKSEMSETMLGNNGMSRVWDTVRSLMTAGTTDPPDFRGVGQDYEVFERLASVCFQSILPRKMWLSNFDSNLISEYVTVADEALAYLILENNLEDWMKIARGEVVDSKQRKRTTKYTVTSRESQGGGVKKGWTRAGKERYNRYYEVVEDARKRERVIAMERNVLENWKKESNNTRKRTRNGEDEEGDRLEPFKPRGGFDIKKIRKIKI